MEKEGALMRKPVSQNLDKLYQPRHESSFYDLCPRLQGPLQGLYPREAPCLTTAVHPKYRRTLVGDQSEETTEEIKSFAWSILSQCSTQRQPFIPSKKAWINVSVMRLAERSLSLCGSLLQRIWFNFGIRAWTMLKYNYKRNRNFICELQGIALNWRGWWKMICVSREKKGRRGSVW